LFSALEATGLRAVGFTVVHSENETDQAKRNARACTLDLIMDLLPVGATPVEQWSPQTWGPTAEESFLRIVGDQFSSHRLHRAGLGGAFCRGTADDKLPPLTSAVDTVECGFDGFDVFGAPSREVGAFGSAAVADSVLVRGALPGAVGVGEVDGNVGLDLEHRVGGTLFASVPGQRSAALVGQRGHLRRQRVLHREGAVAGERRFWCERSRRSRSREADGSAS
jgi:hypothetical protein